ncbi:hypothetical protein PA0653 [Candidatus Phytoplasma australiense]|uniref:DUF2963 domain-containing protein n=1 Tax=Phytoplasma australiense TaxID=59748 RepID=B1VAL4_PHYAS|nr:hypothetical protein PA0653 [Candidatus Phytoplasma australiense]
MTTNKPTNTQRRLIQSKYIRQEIERRNDGAIEYICEYNRKTGKRVGIIEFYPDGKNIRIVYEINPTTDNITKSFIYNLSDQRLLYIREYDQYGCKFRTTYYNNDDQTVNFIENIFSETGKITRHTPKEGITPPLTINASANNQQNHKKGEQNETNKNPK